MRISTVGAALLVFAASASAQLIGPAVPLTNTRYSTSGQSAAPTLTANGQSFLAAWGTPTGIRVSRIDGTSARIGTPIGGPAVGAPALAPYGDGYVIGWTDGIRFLADDGEPAGDPLSIGDDTTRSRLASNGSTVMLAYLHVGFEFEVLGAFIDAHGRILRKGVHLGTQSTRGPVALPFAAASNGDGFAFVSEEGLDLELKIYDGAGTLRSYVTLEGPVTGSAIPRYATLASDGHGYLAVWASGHALKAAAVRSTGDIIATGAIVPARDFHTPMEPALAFDGEAYVCTYLDSMAMAIRVSHDLEVTSETTLDDAAVASTVAAANGVTLAGWARPPARLNDFGTGGAAFARFVAADGTLGDTFPISVAAHDQTYAAGASNGTDALVAWMEGNSQQVSLMGGLLRADGSWRELGKLARGAAATPVVASNGHDFLVAGAFGAIRVSADGDPIDRAPLTLGALNPTGVAWSGRDYVVVGEIAPPAATAAPSPGLGAIAISPSGIVGPLRNIRPPIDGDRAERPAVASNGNDLLVTYTWWEPPCFTCFFPVITGSSARALRLSTSLDTIVADIQFYPVDAVTATAAAWNGDDYVAIALDYGWMFAARIAPDGTVLGRTRLNPGNMNTKMGVPSALAIGSDTIVAWREVGLPGSINSGDAFVCTMREDGTATTPQIFDPGARSTGDPIVVADVNRGARVIRSLFLSAAPYFEAERLVVHALGVPQTPARPALQIRANSNGILLSWDDPAGAAGYRVEYRNARHDWQEIESWYAPGPKNVPIEFGAGGAYQFRVKAIGWSGASYSNVVTIDNTQRRRAVH